MSNDDAVLELVNEFLERAQAGEEPTIDEYCLKHPELTDEIREVLPALVMLEDLQPNSDDDPDSDSVNLPDQIGDYRIIGQIGRGGMGVVYEAEQESLGRRVALKVLPSNQLDSKSAQIRFQREARAAAKMHHTNIVPVFEVGNDGDYFFYAMQLIAGRGLDEIIDELKLSDEKSEDSVQASLSESAALTASRASFSQVTLNQSQSGSNSGSISTQSSASTAARTGREAFFHSGARLALQVADALAFAHDRGVIHRDIKPSNLLMDVHGVTWVADFGLAKMLEDDNTLTQSGDYLGTLRYMSPERFRGRCDERSDVYALGLTVYELLVLRPGFDATDRVRLIYLINNTEPPRPRSIDPNIPRDLETIVLKCIEKEPDARYKSATALHDDLQRFLNDEPILARRLSSLEQFSRWVRRNRGLAASLAGIAALMIVLSVGGVLTALYQAELRSSESGARYRAEVALNQAEVARDDANAARDAAREEQRKAEDAEKAAELAAQSAEEAARKEGEARDAAEGAQKQLKRILYLSQSREALYLRDQPGGIHRIREVVENWQDDQSTGIQRGWEWDLLKASAEPDGIEIPLQLVTGLGWSPDDRWLAVIAHHQVLLFETETGQQIGKPIDHPDRVLGLDVSSDGKQIVTSCSDGFVRFWNAAKHQMLHQVGPLGHRPRELTWSHNDERIGYAVDGVGIYVLAANDATAEPIQVSSLATPCQHLEWSPDDSRLVGGLWFDHHMTIYDVEKRQVERRFDQATRVLWKNGHDVDAVLHARGSGRIDLYDSSGESREQMFSKHSTWAVGLDVHAGSGIFASVAEDNIAIVWDLNSGRPRRTHVSHTDALNRVQISPSASKVASVGRESIHIWNVRDSVRTPLENSSVGPGIRQHRVTGVSWHPDGRQLSTSAYDGKTQVWDLDNLTAQPVFVDINYSVAYHPDGTHIATGAAGHGGVIVDTSGKSELRTFPGGQFVYWNADGSQLGSVGPIGPHQTLQVFNFPSLELVFSERTLPYAMCFHPSDSSFCFVNADGEISRRSTDGSVHLLPGFEGEVYRMEWSPDGTRLAAACADNVIRVWESLESAPVALIGHRDTVYGVSWHPDGTRLASASDDGTVRLWETNTYSEVLSISDSVSGACCLDFSPDGSQLAVGRQNGLVTIWGTTGTGGPVKIDRPSPKLPVVAVRPDTLYRAPMAERLLATDQVWSEPKRLSDAVNSEFEEYEPFLSPDGCVLYFHSDRPGGFGGFDLWMCRRDSVDSEWNAAENLGEVINGTGDDDSSFITPDGLNLYFTSDRDDENRDIWMSVRDSPDKPWQPPTKLPSPINTIYYDIEPTLSADGRTMIFVSTREGNFDLWMARRDDAKSPWNAPEKLAGDINTADWQGSPSLLGEDFGSVLLLHSFDGEKLASRKSAEDSFQWSEPFVPDNRLGHIYSPFISDDGDTLHFRRLDVLLGTFDLWTSQRVKRDDAAEAN